MGSNEILVALLIILPLIFSLVTLANILSRRVQERRLLWFLIALLLPVVGPLLYWAAGRTKVKVVEPVV